MTAGERFGATLLAGFLVAFVAAVVAITAGALDALIASVVPVGGVLLAVVAVVALVSRGGGRVHTAHVHGGRRATVIAHEAGHAAVAHGVGAPGITARLVPGGGGEVTCDVSRMSPAEYVAYMRAGKAAAGGSGDCQRDIAAAKAELDALPPDQRKRVSRDADAIVRRHAGSAFGQRVARSLARTGRFR